MLPSVLRRRLDRLNNLQLYFLASQQEHVQLDTTPFYCSPKGVPSATAFSIGSDASAPAIERPSTYESTYESASGIRWNSVAPASSLLRNAGFEAQQRNPDTRLVRSLFITGLGYMLDSLPSDLTVDEARAIHGRLPDSVRESSPGNNMGSMGNTGSSSSSSPPPSYLHRLIAALIVYMLVCVQVILPYLRILLHSIYAYERKYRLTEKLMATAVNTADGVGRSARNVGVCLSMFHQGRITAAVGDAIYWLSESVAGGVYDGVSEAVSRRPV